MKKESMVIYESAYKAINYLPDEKLQLEAFKGLMEYGFYGVVPESENPFVNMIYVQAIPSMRSAKERYEKAVENGKMGGRPTEVSTEEIMEMKKSGMTNKQIADKLHCSVKNIENRVTTYRKGYPNNPNNLSVSVSDTVSVSESVTDTVSSSASVNPVAKENNNFSPERELSPIELILLEEAEQAKAKTEVEEVVSTSGEDIFVHGMREQREQAVAFVDDKYECGSDEELPF